jgi:cell division septal protein FtsQ
MARRPVRQPNYIKHARSFGHGSGRRKRTTSFSDSVATMRLSKSARHSKYSKVYRKIAKYLLVCLLIVGWGSLPIFLPFFRISSVTYTGFSSPELQKVAEKTVADSLTIDKPWWPRSNFFIFNTETLTTELLKEPRLRSVEVQKTFPHNLIIIAAEKSSRVVYFSPNGQHAVLDEEGGLRQSFTTETSTSFGADIQPPTPFLSPSTTTSTTLVATPLTYPSRSSGHS